ncbi:MAG: MFS transporter [Bacillota bacterium]
MYFKLFNFFFYMSFAPMSYLNMYLSDIGLSSVQIGSIHSGARLIALLVLPFWGMISDYYKANKKLLLIALSGSIILLLSFLLTEKFLIIFIIMVVFLMFQSPIVPLVDSLLLSHLEANSNLYGRFRVFGSYGYTLLVLGAGVFLEKTSTSYLFYMSGFFLLLTFMATTRLPQGKKALKVSNIRNFKILFRNKDLFIFLLYTFFIQLTFQVNIIYFPLYVMDYGGREALLGAANMLAAGSEIIIFRFSEKFIERFKIKNLFLISAVSYAVRWSLIAFFPIKSIMIGSQLLNGLSFALFHVVAVYFINLITADEFKATGMNLYAVTVGLSIIIGSFAGGIIYEDLGGFNLYIYCGITALLIGIMYYLFLKYKKEQSYNRKSEKKASL